MATNPFQTARQQIPQQLLGQAEVFGQQGASFLSSTGSFDPNIEQALRTQNIGQAQTGIGAALSNLAGQEANFFEDQRRFDEQIGLQREIFEAEKKAGEPNIWDIITGVGSFLPGVGSVFQGINALRQTGMFNSGGGEGGQAFFGSGIDTGEFGSYEGVVNRMSVTNPSLFRD